MNKPYKYVQDLIKAAKAAGYTPVPSGRLASTFKCPSCGQKAVVLGNGTGIEVDACICGYRHINDPCPPEL